MVQVVASAPGKVLMTGGYLILERPNAGLVLSTSARFYAIIKPLYDDIKPESSASEWIDVKLTSPQLLRESIYKLSTKNLTLQCAYSSESSNPFVEQAVKYSVAAAHATLDENKKDSLRKLLLQGLDITILGSNDFYSYRNQIEARGLPLMPESLAALPPFASITFNAEEADGGNCKPEVAKTGLGSSAAMTTAVVAALLHYLEIIDLSLVKYQHQEKDSLGLDMVHMIAQTSHCIAQGKVGSGFDVSAAVYGSQRYVRFSPEVISSAQAATMGAPLQEVIVDILKGKWNHERTKLSLPPLMTLLLGEPGAGGSHTPSMVGAVKKWQKSDPQKSLETWRMLSEANSALETQISTLNKLAKNYREEYQKVINSCSVLKPEKWIEQATEQIQGEVTKALLGARDAMLRIRYHMRQMGEAAGVPIEPESQTQLLDATMNPQLKPHVVIFPFMAEGHILPLLDLSKALSCQRIKVTIITTPSNAKAIAKKIVNYPAIHITEISFPYIAGLPIGCENTSQLPSFQFYIPFLIATKHLKQPFEQVLQEMKETNILPLCVISDFFLGWTFSVCQSFGLPRLVFHGMSVLSMAICKSSWAHGSKLRSKSISESLNLPGLNLPFDLTIGDLPEGIIYASDVDKDDPYFQLLEEAGKSESNSWGVVVNSFIELERNYISSYEAFYNDNCKAWCLGPLLLYDDDDDKEIQDFKVRINGRNHQNQNQSSIYIKWLNEQVPLGSVIYISFGSQAEVSDAQLNDVAFGLEESGHFFIYVVRKKTWSPPNGLEQRIEGKGFIVRDWVDQRQILSHKSVGGFLSHCGWNSVIESISFGVPILAWPMIAFSDQSLNAKFVVEGLGIGVDIRKVKNLGIESCSKVSKKAICEGVKELMGEEKGKKARERAKALSRVSRQAVEEGGSSLQSLNQLIEKLQGEIGCVLKI